jgi:hypothetical protein
MSKRWGEESLRGAIHDLIAVINRQSESVPSCWKQHVNREGPTDPKGPNGPLHSQVISFSEKYIVRTQFYSNKRHGILIVSLEETWLDVVIVMLLI